MLLTRRTILVAAGSLSVPSFAMSAAKAAAGNLRPPFFVPKAKGVAGAPSAVPPTAPLATISTESRYRKDDPTRSIVDPDLSQAYDAAVAPLRTFSRAVIKTANRYMESRGQDLDAAAQTGAVLKAWADASSLDGIVNETGYFARSSALAPAALAFLQVQGALSDGVCKPVYDWLEDRATATQAYYGTQKSISAINNHRYMSGLFVLATGIAGNRRDLFAWGVDAANIGTSQITGAGALPHEVERGKRALGYHAFALGPLLLIAEAAARNGDTSVYEGNNGALHRLVDFTLSQIDDPDQIVDLAGAAQEPLGSNGAAFDGNDVAWLEIYEARYPGRSRWSKRMSSLRPLVSTGLGGNLTMLFNSKAPPKAESRVQAGPKSKPRSKSKSRRKNSFRRADR